MSTPIFFAISRAAFARLGPSLILRIPWSVKFSDKMNNMVMLPFRHCCAPTADHRTMPARGQGGGGVLTRAAPAPPQAHKSRGPAFLQRAHVALLACPSPAAAAALAA